MMAFYIPFSFFLFLHYYFCYTSCQVLSCFLYLSISFSLYLQPEKIKTLHIMKAAWKTQIGL